jgi:hypothetical protein
MGVSQHGRKTAKAPNLACANALVGYRGLALHPFRPSPPDRLHGLKIASGRMSQKVAAFFLLVWL